MTRMGATGRRYQCDVPPRPIVMDLSGGPTGRLGGAVSLRSDRYDLMRGAGSH